MGEGLWSHCDSVTLPWESNVVKLEAFCRKTKRRGKSSDQFGVSFNWAIKYGANHWHYICRPPIDYQIKENSII